MVAVVQLVEHQVVILGVAGSSPVSHPTQDAPGVPGGVLRLRQFLAELLAAAALGAAAVVAVLALSPAPASAT